MITQEEFDNLKIGDFLYCSNSHKWKVIEIKGGKVKLDTGASLPFDNDRKFHLRFFDRIEKP